GDELADGGRGSLVGAGLERPLQVLLERRGCGDGVAARVVDDLGVDVLRRAMHGQARTVAGDLLDLTADARRAALGGFLVGHGQYSLPCKTGAAMCGKAAVPPSRDRAPWRCTLLLLAFLADDPLVGITHALALVGLG